ncbi:RnfH family protein [uncultured Legionella sp.]|uniref:RnfH family protein n=1 Tax=uncultured Legionella sp. TaxID=210934 RepID=UPI00260D75D5|nr:RnfH family protein [uncultured Legionella sp.]
MVKIELVYITNENIVFHLPLELPAGATVHDALNASDVFNIHPETKELPVGIYAKMTSLNTVLKDGDRVELYRPLVRDPKEKRRQMARLKNKKG